MEQVYIAQIQPCYLAKRTAIFSKIKLFGKGEKKKKKKKKEKSCTHAAIIETLLT